MAIKICSNPKCKKILTEKDFPHSYKCFGPLCNECKLKAQYILNKSKVELVDIFED